MAKKSHTHTSWCCCGNGSNFWGWFLLIVGGYFLATAMGWIPEIPFWPIVLILVGVYLLIKNQRK